MKAVRFSRFVLDVERRLLLEDDRPVHLSPKAYEMLVLLAERSPAAVSKTEIRDRLWPDTFVADVGLATVVNELRKALGERGRGPGLLRTVHGFGYAFEGGARLEQEASAAPALAGAMAAHCRAWLLRDNREYPLEHGDNTIGRTGDVRVRVDDATVSRRHATIAVDGARATVEDLGSKNGTFVRGRRITAREVVADGDVIRFGDVETVFRNLDAPSATATVRE
jgi:DNA-binding winged helix-turn-helix (wHTH) protein